MTVYKYKLETDIGTLIKSPCKECEKRVFQFPECIDTCEILDHIHTILAEVRFCTRGEDY